MPIIDEIKDRVKMSDLLSAYGIERTRGTNIYKCPFHGDKHPSAIIVKNSDKFHCFVCNQSWDIFDVVQKFENCDFPTAIKICDNKMGLGIARTLTKAEKEELFFLQLERQREKDLKAQEEQWQREIRNRLTEKLRLYEALEAKLCPTIDEMANGRWIVDDAYFKVIKEQERLETLYNLLYSTDAPENTYYYLYGTDRKAIYERIKLGQIKI